MPFVIRQRKPFIPKNNGSVNIARSAFDQLLPIANQSYQNALAVNGIPILYYRKRKSGLLCSCQGAGVTNTAPTPVPGNLPAGISVLNPAGHGTDEYMQSMLQGTVFSIDRYGSRNSNVNANGDDNPQRSVPHSPLIQSKDIRNHADNLDDPFAEIIDAGDAADLFANDFGGASAGLTAASATAGCAVCLGTGFVGGYDPANSFRSVMDARAEWSGVTIDATTTPNSLKVIGNSVSLKALIPAGAVGLDACRLFNGKEPVAATMLVDGKEMNETNVDEFADGLVHTFTFALPAGTTTITHFELQFEMALEPVYADWSKLSFNENLQFPENMDTPTVYLSPTLPSVNMYDIIAEAVYRRLWKITAHTPEFDRDRQVHSYEAQCRVLQQYEIASLLPIRRNRVWYEAVRIPGAGFRHRPDEPEMNPYKRNRGGGWSR